MKTMQEADTERLEALAWLAEASQGFYDVAARVEVENAVASGVASVLLVPDRSETPA